MNKPLLHSDFGSNRDKSRFGSIRSHADIGISTTSVLVVCSTAGGMGIAMLFSVEDSYAIEEIRESI